MDWNKFQDWAENHEEITSLTNDLNLLIEDACKKDYFGLEHLETVQGHMDTTLKQGLFWLEQKNVDRFIYDLKGLTKWLCDYTEVVEAEHNGWSEDNK